MAQDIANQIHSSLIKNKKTLAVAESCTGGLLSKMLTDLPESSKYFLLGIVAYNNKVKENILGINPKIIARHGAVSAEVAKLMAKSAKDLAKTDFGIGITGIAGPAGATARKPVGLVFIAVEGRNKGICERFIFKGTRQAIRKKTSLKALHLLQKLI